MPYVLSRLIYNVSGKGEMRVGARQEAQRHELGVQPPATFDRWGNCSPRGRSDRATGLQNVRTKGLQMLDPAWVHGRRNEVWAPPALRLGCFDGLLLLL